MLMETDGTVLMEGGGVSATWYRLTPSASGSYALGTWSQVASMGLQRLYYPSNVLPDGRVLVLGGEYSGSQGQQNLTNQGEIYNPVTNTWSSIATYPNTKFGDDPTALLPGGLVLAGYIFGPQTYIYDPVANTWSQAATKLRGDRSDEETWLELPDGSILSYDVFSSIAGGVGAAQRYLPSSNTWVDAGTVPVLLSSTSVSDELGPAFLLPDGRVFFMGGNSNTAYYTPATNSWAAGPAIPGSLGADDAPGAMLPDGKILFIADTPLFQGPSHIFEFDPGTNTYTDLSSLLPASFLSGGSFGYRMLVLPTGQVLINNGSSQLYVYTPDLPAVASGVPRISTISVNPDGSLLLTGTLLNGISEGAAYGDDAEMSTNYPIVRLTDSSNHVFYARTFGWSSDAVATGTAPGSTNFALPAGLPAGIYSVSVVANGIASPPVSLTVPVVANDPSPTIVTAAAATPNPVTGTTTSLSVLGGDAVKGEATLTYTWTATSVPAGAPSPTYAVNGTNAAKSDMVTFARAGTYTFQVVVTNLAGLSSSSSVVVTVGQTLTSLTVTPALASVARGGTQQFSVTGAQDQFGASMSLPATVTWSLASGGGTITNTGLYTAPAEGTTATVTATATVTTGPATGSAAAYVLTSPWLTQDVGSVAAPGAAGDNGNGTYTLVGAGQGFVSGADSFRYAYQSLSGDGLILAHVGQQQSASTQAVAGVVIRAGLSAGSPMAAMLISVGGVASFVDRATDGSDAATMTGGPPSASWVKLLRLGDTFTGFVSADGVTWVQVGTATVAMGSAVDVGLAASAGSGSSVLTTASFDQVFVDATPTVVNAASATPNPVGATTTSLTVTGGDNAGESTLVYTWAATSVPAGAPSPTLTTNGTNAAKNDIATFFQAGTYSFTVTISNPGGLSITSSVGVTVNQTISSIVINPPAATLSAASSVHFSAMAEDQFGQVLASQPTISWSVQGGGIGGTIDPTGLYTRPSPGIGADMIVAASGALNSSTPVTVTVGPAALLTVTDQPPPGITAGVGFNVTTVARDAFGNVASGFGGTVTLGPTANPGGAIIATASAGIAHFTGVTLDNAVTALTLQASSSGLTRATTSAVNVVAAKASQLVVTAQPAGSVIAGSQFGFVVQAEDPFGNTDQTFAGTVTLALLTNPAGAMLGGTLTVTAGSGVARFLGLSLDEAGGGEVVQASSSDLPSTTARVITVVPASAVQLIVSTPPPPSITANQPFGLAVTAEDGFGNVDTAFTGNVTIALASDPGAVGPGGTLIVSAVAGVATFSSLTIAQAATGQTLEASASGLTGATTAPFTVVAARATQLVMTPAPAGSITAGVPFGAIVSAEDPFGNLDPSFAGQVVLGLTDDQGVAMLGGATTVRAKSGVATFSNLVIDRSDSSYSLQATSAGVASAGTGPFSVGAALPSQLAFVQQPPARVTAGSGFTLAVVAEDAFGNVVPTFADSVALSLGNNPGGPGTALVGGASRITSSGEVVFTGLVLDTVAAGYTVNASSGSLNAATSNPVSVRAAAATRLAIVSLPSASVTAGTQFGVSVGGVDPYGNVDPTFTGSVTLALATNPASVPLAGTLTRAASQGVATFADLTLTTASNGNRLVASSPSVSSVTTAGFTVAAAPATQLVLTTSPPASVVAGAPFGLTAAAEDSFGNVDTGFAGNVDVAIGQNPAGDVLGGTPAAPIHLGIATFSDLTLDLVSTGDTLVLTNDRLTGVPTRSINVSPGAATRLVMTTEPPASLVAGDSFGLAVAAQDQFGNPVPAYGSAVTLAAGNGAIQLGGMLTATPVAGVATFSELALDVAGTYTLSASSGGLQAAASNSLTVSAAAAATLALMTEPPASVTAGNGFGLVALVQDRFGNTVTGDAASVTVGLGDNPAGDALGGTFTAIAGGGAATFSNLFLTRVATGLSLVVSSDALTPAMTTPVAVVAATATRLVIAHQPPPSIAAGAQLGFAVAAEDRFGNLAPNTSGLVTAALADGSAGAPPGGIVAVPLSAGIATFSDIVLTTATTGLALQVSSGSLSPAITASLDVTAAPATQVVVTGEPPSSVTAGDGFGVTAVVEDRYGNPTPDFVGSVTLTLPNNAATGTVPGTVALTPVSGVASFSNLILTEVATGDVLQLASAGLTTATTSPISVAAARASQIVVTDEPPTSVTAGSSFGLVVAAEDRFGNLDASYAGRVSLALLASTGDTLGGPNMLAVDSGMATFSDLTLARVASGDAIQVSSGSLAAATTTPFSVAAAPATQLVVTTQPPSGVTAGNGFGLVIEAEDPFGNPDPSFTGPVALTLTDATAAAVLTGTARVPADAGVATFSGLMVNMAGAGYSLRAASDGLPGTTTDPFRVAAAAATRVVITDQPPPRVTAGTSFGLAVFAEDDYGNLDPTFSNTLTLSLGPGANLASGSLGGSLTANASGGVASFSGVTLNTASDGVTLDASGNNLQGAETNPTTVTAAAADHLVVTTEPPGTVIAGAGFGLVVSALDRFGNVDSNYSGSVALTTSANPTGAPIGGVLSLATQDGVAAFSGLTLDRAADGYMIQAASPGLVDAASASIAVSAAAATQLVIASEPPSSVNAGAGFGLVAQAEDPFGNVDPRYGGHVDLALASNPGGATLGGALGVSATGGVVSFSVLTLDRGGVGYMLVLSGQGLSAATTRLLDVIPPPAQVISASIQNQPIARHKLGKVILIQFDQAMSAAAATNPESYMLSTATAGKTHGSKAMPFARPSYNPATNTVTLRPLGNGTLRPPVQLRIVGSVLTDALGRPLDGNHDGQPGGDFIATLRKTGITVTVVAGPQGKHPLSAAAVDAALKSLDASVRKLV
jgi:hypothetical protein